MTRRLAAHLALSASLVVLLGTPVLAAIAPVPDVQPPQTRITIGDQGPTLAELSYERLLEESLQQSLASYLGPSRFLIQVRVALSSEAAQGSSVMQQAQAPAAAPPTSTLYLPPEEPEAAVADSPLLPGLGNLRADDLPSQDPRPGRRPALPAAPEPAFAPAQPQAPVSQPQQAQPPRIERIRVALVLPTDLTSGDEDYVKNLVYQRADLNLARGDTIDVVRRDFPRQGEKAPAPAGGTSLPPWLWGVIGALSGAGLVGAMAFARRKPTPSAAPVAPAQAPSVGENTRAAEAILAGLQAASKPADLLPVRQDLLVQLLDHPDSGERFLRKVLSEEGGLDRAVALTRAMGLNVAKRLFTGLLPQEWKAIELASLDRREVSTEDQRAVLEEALYAVLREKSEQRGSDKSSPFAFLSTLDDSQIIYLLEDEGPRVQALLLSQLPPDRAVGLMRLKPPAEQGAIAAAMGELHLLPMSSFLDLANHLSEKATKAPSFETAVTNGLGLLVNLLDHSDRATEQGILSGLSSQNPRLLAQVREAYLTFDDLAGIPREILKDALREADKESLAEVLRDAGDPVREAVMAALTDRARRIVEDALAQPPMVARDGAARDAIRKDLVARVRQLMQLGRFTVKELRIPQEELK
ncbi:MAG TPA: FliG C-terminal domain-containing protein [Pantanalinema sp.]